MRLANLTKQDLCRLVCIELNTLNGWIERPGLIPFSKILVMSGLFGMPPEEFVYILLRNKPQISKEGKWYVEELRQKHQ